MSITNEQIQALKAAAEMLKEKSYAKDITKEQIEKYLIFDGRDFYWKERQPGDQLNAVQCKVFNSRKAGKKAGSIEPQGYVCIQIMGKKYKAHRLIWCMVYGAIPSDMQVDHINHIRHDNRLENLRLVSQSENERNASIRKDNGAGRTGVRWHETQLRWHAFIRHEGKQKHLGSFKEFSDAVNARKLAEIKFGYHKNHGKQHNAAAGITLDVGE